MFNVGYGYLCYIFIWLIIQSTFIKEAYLAYSNPSRPSTRSHRFDEVPAPRVQRSSFDLSHKRKTTFNAGYLIPLTIMEVLPGDTFSVQAQFFGRMQTLDFPTLDNMYFDTFWFYCNNRILWDNWPKFLGAQEFPGASIDYVVPYLGGSDPTYFQFAVHSLGDYFGLPIGQNLGPEAGPGSIDVNINALPFRMYNRIWQDWFRAQELQSIAEVNLATDDGPDAPGNFVLLKRGKRHDYITSCLIAPQRGEAVALPIGDSAPVIGDGQALGLWNGSVSEYLNYNNDSGFNGQLGVSTTGGAVGTAPAGAAPVGDVRLGLHTNPTLSHAFADLSEAVSATINDMREAIAIQQMLERDARFGTRYVERIFAQFGVVVPDYTAQRPEYLGGSIDRVGVMSVPQTTASPAVPTMSDAKGALAAYAQIQATSGFNRSFVEHGYIMCIGSLRADLSYQQRIDRMWSRETRYDFYDPMMAHLGEQPVYDREVWYDAATTGNGIFGYQERWAEMRMRMDDITGKFRSAAAGTLDSWHLALNFSAQPDLNATFIEDAPPVDRILAIDTATQPNVLMDMAFKVRAARPIPVYSVPGLERL